MPSYTSDRDLSGPDMTRKRSLAFFLGPIRYHESFQIMVELVFGQDSDEAPRRINTQPEAARRMSHRVLE